MLQRFLDNSSFVFQPRRKPGLTGRIVRSYLRYLAARTVRQRPLRNVDVAISYACNLRCAHCSSDVLEGKRRTLRADDYRNLAEQALDLGAIYFAFTGGEPLLNKDLEDIFGLFSPRSCLIGLQTNAMLLDPKRAKSLYDAGLDSIQVSLDSGDPAEHDAFRNCPGAFRQTMDNVNRALALGIRVIFSATLTHSDIRSANTTALLEFAKSKNVPVTLSVPCAVGKWSGNFSEQLTDDDRQYLAKLMKAYPQLRRDFHSNYLRLGCSAGTEKLYITPAGEVIPCPFIHISFGNITLEPLKVIRDRMLKVDRFTEYAQTCLAGEDKSFIDSYIIPSYDAETLPQPYSKHPKLSGLDGGDPPP